MQNAKQYFYLKQPKRLTKGIVYWDYQNCPLPKSTYQTLNQFQKAIQQYEYTKSMMIEDTFIFGDIPNKLQTSKITIVNGRDSRFQIMTNVLKKIHEPKEKIPTFIIITGDDSFSNTFKFLKNVKLPARLIYPKNSSSLLTQSVVHTDEWSNFLKSPITFWQNPDKKSMKDLRNWDSNELRKLLPYIFFLNTKTREYIDLSVLETNLINFNSKLLEMGIKAHIFNRKKNQIRLCLTNENIEYLMKKYQIDLPITVDNYDDMRRFKELIGFLNTDQSEFIETRFLQRVFSNRFKGKLLRDGVKMGIFDTQHKYSEFKLLLNSSTINLWADYFEFPTVVNVGNYETWKTLIPIITKLCQGNQKSIPTSAIQGKTKLALEVGIQKGVFLSNDVDEVKLNISDSEVKELMELFQLPYPSESIPDTAEN
ncbi:hypothetical protein BC833DRAFT_609920 [Globomyces pollinis-pini]|nr:hypothetical protein BC833DRAFT_609920 [Globomyces pollinis-pini]